uniref:Uncharacterized protein n=1 Tax=Rhizophora mucronata TaxID=61149 RepID=A0A2P2QP82_RHIMU
MGMVLHSSLKPFNGLWTISCLMVRGVIMIYLMPTTGYSIHWVVLLH